QLRFRQILMTAISFILGLLPLVFASGPGAESRRDIGTGVFFGMLVALFTGVIMVPYFFVWVYRLKSRFERRKAA
ncbi:MAG: efflux RND transporter permease subunit, partial [Bacteroidales bacterium]|nr:efflux RND transporter permease subunit [Bacteroidales bacterium]